MKKIGKWCLSVLLAVTLAMPAMAAQPVSSTEAAAMASQAEETAAGESQTDVKETETSQTEIKETESESETETETETETEAPVDPIQKLINQVAASKPVLTAAKCTGFQLTVSWNKVSEL